MSAEMTAASALVIGGGLAGIAAALRLAEAGRRVTLLEARASLGGRAYSYADPRTGRVHDNGQHVIVGACHNLIAFLEGIGAGPRWRLQPRLDVAVYNRAGRRGRLYGAPLPAPAHLLPAFLTYPHLGIADKLRAVRGLLAAMRADRRQPALEDIDFRHWLRVHGQSERAIANLWNVLVEGALNDDVGSVSAAMGLMIVQDGLLKGRHEANVGYPVVSLGEALGGPARRHLAQLGVRIMTGCAARRIVAGEDAVVRKVVVAGGRTLAADAYISAVPFWVLPNLLPPALAAAASLERLAGLRTAPIVNVHLRYDRPVMAGDFRYFVDSPLQWVFNHSAIRSGHGDNAGDSGDAGDEAGGQSLTVSISAAWDYIDRPRAALAQGIAAEMRAVFPGAGRAVLREAVVVKQRHATFRCAPGAARLRPGPVTASPNLFLAGEWTDTGWPSTMEGAVISGYNAAAAALSAAGAGLR